MTNHLVGDVYQKIIEEVVLASTNDFEESGVGQATLNELRQAWQQKLSARGVAQMPWDPKPEPVQRMPNGVPHPVAPPPAQSYQGYEDPSLQRSIKVEANDHGSNGYVPPQPQQGGINRAQELVQERFGSQAAASAFQRPGLALPGPPQPKPQGLQLPGQTAQAQQAQHAAYAQQMRQQAQMQNAQLNARVKVENGTPNMPQGQFVQPQRAYGQTDGADDLSEWQSYIADRRAMYAAQIEGNDHVMRDKIAAMTQDLQAGLMLPLDEHKRTQRQVRPSSSHQIPQLDGDVDDDDDIKPVKADDEDEDAINSDLDDPDDDQNAIGDEEDDMGDSILCTYDKVQRVKNKWKCTLKDGVLNTGGKEWLFHKGQGEFEW